MLQIEQQTLASIALSHHEYIPVLERYSLDFCCRGKETLAEACKKKKLAISIVINEMMQSVKETKTQMPFTKMNADQLISYILIHHHFYVKNSVGTIQGHIEKIVTKHGDTFPYMHKVLKLFKEVIEELLPHMEKEEKILFPRIKEMAASLGQNQFTAFNQEFINAPIQMMETEHDNAGQLLFEIRKLTNQYTPPEDACTTHRVCLEELKAFEEDLHQHVHLENNILFPMAKKMVSTVSN